MNNLELIRSYANKVYIPSLTKEEKSIIGYYAETGYMIINKSLRLHRLHEIRDYIEILDAAIKKFRFNSSIKTYRIISVPNDVLNIYLEQFKTGILREEGYVSTSITNYYSTNTNYNFPNVIEFEIDLIMNSLCSYIEGLSSKPYENELLLNRGLKQEIVDLKKEPLDKTHTLYRVKTRVI